MNAPAENVPRLLECGVAVKLAERSHLAIRVYLHLFWGEDSEKPGFGRCAPALLADTLNSSKRAVVAALDELQSNGLIVWSAEERLAYRPGFAERFKPGQPANVNNWYDTAAKLRDGLVAAQVRKDIGPRVELNKERNKAQNTERSTEYLSIPSIPSIPSASIPESSASPPDGFVLEPAGKKPRKQQPDPERLFDVWDAVSLRLPQCRRTDKQQKAAIKALSSEPDLDLWARRFSAANASDFHAIQWKGADFLWCVGNPDKLDTLMHKQSAEQAPVSRNEPFYEKL